MSMALRVVYHPEYEAEWRSLPPAERAALASAAEKLRADSRLGFPAPALSRAARLGSGNCGRGEAGHPGGRRTGAWARRWSC